jgi:hypothetical protein
VIKVILENVASVKKEENNIRVTFKMVKNQYDLYRNKNEYIDRLNKLIPMEILMPLGGAGFVGNELNKE